MRHRIKQNESDNPDNDELKLPDDEMNQQSKIITRNRVQLGRLFGRFGSAQNKFTISSVNKSTSSIVTSGSDTRMDVIYEYMAKSNAITIDEISSFVNYIKLEEYDTESIFDDVGVADKEKSNILCCIKSQLFENNLHNYIKYKLGIVCFNLYFYFVTYYFDINTFSFGKFV